MRLIENSWTSYGIIVQGWVGTKKFPTSGEDEEVAIFFNQNGKELEDLEPNIYIREHRDVIYGTFFLVEGASGECESLKEHQIEKAKKYIEANCL